MKKKFFSILILTLFLMTIFSTVVLAQSGTNIGDTFFGENGMISSLVDGIFDFINDLIGKQFNLPPPNNSKTTSAFGLIITFLIFFAIIYPAAAKLPPFKDSSSTGMRKTFSIAIALAITFFSPLAATITTVMTKYVSSLVNIGIAFAFVLVIWWMIKGGKLSVAKINKYGAEEAKIENETRKVQRDVRMETEMDNREETQLTQLEGVDRDLIANEADLLAKWQRIQRELAGMGALRSDIALERGRQILSVIANVIGEESQETAIQHHLEQITNTLSRETIQEVATLTNDNTLQTKVKNAMPKLKNEVAYISKAIANAKEAESIIQRIEKLNAEELKYQSQVRKLSGEAGDLIRAGNFAQAGNIIGKIVAEVQKERGEGINIEDLVHRAIGLVQNEVAKLHRAIQNE